jgi:hypothetical protein
MLSRGIQHHVNNALDVFYGRNAPCQAHAPGDETDRFDISFSPSISLVLTTSG